MALTDITLRRPEPSDAARIAAIGAEGLATGHATFRDTPHDWNCFGASFMTEPGLALIAEDSGTVLAWAGVRPAIRCSSKLRASLNSHIKDIAAVGMLCVNVCSFL